MIRPPQRALGLDALYQVLDNGVFRILAVAALIPILIFTVVQITPTEVRLLFGLWEWPLENLAQIAAPEGAVDLQAATIGMLLDVVFFSLAGTFGVLFCLAATAFFVPRMLEKGAADVLFHKPISRLQFYLSRYVAGLLFVFLLALVTATGVFCALALFSDFSDPGVFAVVPALTYLFGLIFPVSMLIGTLTRSTVASILLSGVFFMGNGCVHSIWINHELGMFDGLAELNSDGAVQVSVSTSGGSVESEPDEELDEEPNKESDPDAVEPEGIIVELSPWRHLWTVLDVLHFATPKTTSVQFLTKKLRRAASRPTFLDVESGLQLGAAPEGWSDLEALSEAFPLAADLESLGALVYGASSPAGDALALFLRPADVETVTRASGRSREVRERYSDAAQSLLQALGSVEGIEQAVEVPFKREPRFGRTSSKDKGDSSGEEMPGLSLPFFAELLAWNEPMHPSDASHVRALVFKNGDSIGTLLVRSSDPEPVDDDFEQVVAKLGYGKLEGAYGKLLRFDAGWRTNIIQSVASSILFALLVLGLGAWRLSRIDF